MYECRDNDEIDDRQCVALVVNAGNDSDFSGTDGGDSSDDSVSETSILGNISPLYWLRRRGCQEMQTHARFFF